MLDALSEFGLDTKNLVFILVLIVAALVSNRIGRWLITRAFNSTKSENTYSATRFNFFRNAFSFVIWLITIGIIVSIIPKLKAMAVALLAGAGILVAVVGFAAQQTFANIISGVFLVLFQPFRIKDLIKVGSGEYGIVEDITLRHTVIVNFENKRIVIPNSILSGETIVNDTLVDTQICLLIDIGISYDSDIDRAIQIIQDAATEHPNCYDNRTEEEKEEGVPKVVVRLYSFGDHSVNLRAAVWTDRPLFARQTKSDINYKVKKAFDRRGIEIPFPYRTIVYKKDMLPPSENLSDEKA